MTSLDYQSAQYRVGFAYGLRAHSTTPDHDFVAGFEQFLHRFLPVIGTIQLVQKGLVYFEKLRIQSLRQVKRRKGRDLTVFNEKTKDAQQVGLYVFDGMSRTTPPNVFANVHWSSSPEIGSTMLAPVDGSQVGRFVCFAVEDGLLTRDTESVFDTEFEKLYEAMRGIKGGILEHRPYVWNGRAGLEWMYLELTQSIRGKITD